MTGSEKCIACRADSVPLSDAEMQSLLQQVRGWQVARVDGINRLTKEFPFRNFASALQFTNAVGALAEAEDHHPAILTEWGRVTISLWTHAIPGLHRNDFIMAAKIDAGLPLSSSS